MLVLTAVLLIAAVSVSAADTKLVVHTRGHGGRPDVLMFMADLYMAQNPGVEIEVIRGNDDNIAVMLAGGMQVDLFASLNAVWNWKHSLLDITTLAEKDNDGPYQNIPPGLLQGVMLDGRLYAIPQFWGTYQIAYNAAFFDQRGVAPPDDNWTWNDMLNIAKRLTWDTDGDGVYDVWGIGIAGGNANRLRYWLQAAGGDLFNDDYTQVTVDSPQCVDAWRFMYSLQKEHNVINDWFAINSWNLFDTMRVGIVPTTAEDAAKPRSEFVTMEIAAMPIGPVRRATPLILAWVGINNQTQYPELAYDFAKFVVSEEAVSAARAKFPALAVNAAGQANYKISLTQFFRRTDPPRNMQKFIEAIDYAYDPQRAPVGFEGDVTGIIANRFLAALNEEISLPQAIEEMKTELTAGLTAIVQ